MTGMYATFGTDRRMEEQGIILDYGDFRVTVARAGGANKAYALRLDAKVKPHRRAIDLGVLDDTISNRLLREVFAETVVKRWEVKRDGEWVDGIDAPDGGVLPFSRENVITTFEALPDLFTDIREQATRHTLFRQELREGDAGN